MLSSSMNKLNGPDGRAQAVQVGGGRRRPTEQDRVNEDKGAGDFNCPGAASRASAPCQVEKSRIGGRIPGKLPASARGDSPGTPQAPTLGKAESGCGRGTWLGAADPWVARRRWGYGPAVLQTGPERQGRKRAPQTPLWPWRCLVSQLQRFSLLQNHLQETSGHTQIRYMETPTQIIQA